MARVKTRAVIRGLGSGQWQGLGKGQCLELGKG